MRGMARWFKDEQGAAFLEVLLLLPIILVLVFGYIRFTYAARLSTVLQVAAREAAREYAYSNDMDGPFKRPRAKLPWEGLTRMTSPSVQSKKVRKGRWLLKCHTRFIFRFPESTRQPSLALPCLRWKEVHFSRLTRKRCKTWNRK